MNSMAHANVDVTSDGCRKLQQFRREFEQAKNVAHLMLERESIGEVSSSAKGVRDVAVGLMDVL